MAKRKAKGNARKWKADGAFKICRQPLVHLAVHGPAPDATDTVGLRHVHCTPMLFAVARDPHTIFASWNIDWGSVFQKAIPAERLVLLRLIGERGVEKTFAIEPMAAMHYLTTPGSDDSYRVEIGYFQPGDTWNSVAISNEIKMPPQGTAEIADADLATIPFHLSFDRLANLFGAPNDTPLARVVSEFQKHVLSSSAPNELSVETQILRKLNLSLPEIVAAQHDFQKGDSAKLARRTCALLRVTATSPSRGFEAIPDGQVVLRRSAISPG